tara:strand:+ start:146 stop:994 length:849 start_codon:yes stop_codon:yes gene_type:complete
MANRVPLVITNQKLREIANGDTLDIRGNRLKLDSSAIEIGSLILRDSGGTLAAFTAADSTVAASIAGGVSALSFDSANGNITATSADGSTKTAKIGGFNAMTSLQTTGNVTVGGNLTVNGTTTTINSTTLTVDDKNIVLSSGGNAAAASGAGITIDGVSATMLYNTTSHRFDFNRGITSTDSSVFGGDGSSTGVKIDDGSVVIRTGTGSVAYIDLYCEVSNAHKVRVQSPAHSQYSGNITVKLPNVTGTVATVGTATADILLIKDSGGSTVKTIKGAGNSAL